ncbi:hypothetical protein OPIT5_22125 [Opitutaceae bacterium TAV5]|nr:hypothetical protein OPIT5_22125 [Opitutaceae bacterium TAV5]
MSALTLLSGIGITDTFGENVIRSHPLDAGTVYRIRLSRSAPTTCVFPGPLSGLEGANVSKNAADHPPVLLTHQEGANFFTLIALRDDTTAALNVLYQNRVYVLDFVSGAPGDRIVTFLDQPLTGPAAKPQRLSPAALRGLLDRARQHSRLTTNTPGASPVYDYAEPGTVTRYRDFEVTLLRVFRFEAEDTLVFHVRFRNTGDRSILYDPQNLAVRTGSEVFLSSLSDATGLIPPQSTTQGYFAVGSSQQNGRANLTVRDVFSVIVPRVEP